jgi:hypothetical protein
MHSCRFCRLLFPARRFYRAFDRRLEFRDPPATRLCAVSYIPFTRRYPGGPSELEGTTMSAIGAIGGYSAISYQTTNRMMQDAASVEEGDEDGELLVETESAMDIEFDETSDEQGEGTDTADGVEGSPLGSQVDAWG